MHGALAVHYANYCQSYTYQVAPKTQIMFYFFVFGQNGSSEQYVLKISSILLKFPLYIHVSNSNKYKISIQRVPTLCAFWDLEKPVLHEIRVSGTELGPLLTQKSPLARA